ncbi:topless-related protein 2-like [Apium graveolens]|uniref:topless-related protein 2-like n=1 Tax=Apium graveolens TaxID=4045 RepID=UPI003D7A5C09
MDSLTKDLLIIVLQYLREKGYNETVLTLEKESGFFFNLGYLEEKVLSGEWDEVEKYLSQFTKVEDNRYSTKIYFEIRKQKYLEALDRNEKSEALDILLRDLKVFSNERSDLYGEMTELLPLDNFRDYEHLSRYGDIKEARNIMMTEVKRLIRANPLFTDKLDFPMLCPSRLNTLINQSLNWQHQWCKPVPHIETLFTDRIFIRCPCGSPHGAFATPAVNMPATGGAMTSAYGIDAPFPVAASAPNPNALAGWLSNAGTSSAVQPAAIPNQVSGMKHPFTPPVTLGMLEFNNADNEQLLKRPRTAQPIKEVITSPAVQQKSSQSLDVLPTKVALALQQGSSTVKSMEFHPFLHTLLLVGCSNGEVALWDVKMREKVLSKSFEIWNVEACSAPFQASDGEDAPISVTRITWSSDGNYLGAAFDKHLIHLYAYAYAGANNISQHLEIDAHVGGVNDLAFTPANKELRIVTCGDDKLVKVWDMSGRKLYNFEGHDAPVYSICPYQKENMEFILSTATNGKIKAWIYDNMVTKVDTVAPGRWCTKMLYSADGNRLFSCGTSKYGYSYLVEWNPEEGTIIGVFSGLSKKSVGVVQFDTTQNKYLAAGEDSQIKFWDMDRSIILLVIDADGGLSNVPCLKFNKEGSLLAVTTEKNEIKILASEAGLRLLE